MAFHLVSVDRLTFLEAWRDSSGASRSCLSILMISRLRCSSVFPAQPYREWNQDQLSLIWLDIVLISLYLRCLLLNPPMIDGF